MSVVDEKQPNTQDWIDQNGRSGLCRNHDGKGEQKMQKIE